jgi:hypothetical protein
MILTNYIKHVLENDASRRGISLALLLFTAGAVSTQIF